MRRICIFCGANPGLDPEFQQQALNLADAMAARKIGLVYGGSSTGLMGVIADRALEHNSEVIGIMPTNLVDTEIAHTGLTELMEVSSMSDRKQAMQETADAFVALPGGYGTLDELFEALTNAQLHLHSKPVGILNVNGYFDSLLTFLDQAEQQGLLKSYNRRLLKVGTTPEELLENLFQKQK
ncbi:TIGR00730 family Rossman fold protein [Sansalvadorimonas sp. 2012CJ34-2]|uniref:Cytokinin riboside 5'-monophosphate phosphoribohydrolase n=1 Tax=Parendozoicomonas callyspongiae TaxID=2942213 RepID=A0ABT0PCU2_9GAMM|nr:TIGR00730 family Rossman fold protein [Sansalvadorimonas sp. 2012CJ34-2]MCL6269202.1 TIGR00730 family Rossman fold protein [Sansalvadorimonas sp. 2012CJ34-2]